MQNILHPTQTTTSIEEKELKELPLIFKICVKPGFDVEELRKEGYDGIYEYFLGKSRYSSIAYGWSGHGNDTFLKDFKTTNVGKFLCIVKKIKKVCFRCV